MPFVCVFYYCIIDLSLYNLYMCMYISHISSCICIIYFIYIEKFWSLFPSFKKYYLINRQLFVFFLINFLSLRIIVHCTFIGTYATICYFSQKCVSLAHTYTHTIAYNKCTSISTIKKWSCSASTMLLKTVFTSVRHCTISLNRELMFELKTTIRHHPFPRCSLNTHYKVVAASSWAH